MDFYGLFIGQFFYIIHFLSGYQYKNYIISFIRMPKKASYKNAPPIKKTGYQGQKKLTYQQRFDGVSITPLIAAHHDRIKGKFATLSKLLLRHTMVWNKIYSNQITIMRNYIQYYHEYYEYDQFDSQFSLLPSLDVNLYTVPNEQLIYKSINIFKNCLWPIRFGTKFTARLKDYAIHQILYILSFVMLIAEGNFHGKFALNKQQTGEYGWIHPIQYRFIPYNRFFIMKIFREKNVLFQVGVEKIPISKGGVIKRYQFRNYIQFLDILSDQVAENPKKLQETVERFGKLILEDVAKRDHSDQLAIQAPKNRKKHEQMFEQSVNPYTGINEVFQRDLDKNTTYNFRPFVFKPYYVSLNQNSTLIFNKDMKRWVSSDYLTKLEKKAFNEYQKKVNDSMIKRFLDFESAKTLVELLTKIPNFRVSLTNQQKDVIGENGNVLVIGRSGTGKTTCAVLRLFAIEMLFKIRLSLFKKKFQSELKDTRCSADDIDDSMGLHCIFLTASPVLINQIQRYYRKLTDNIKEELEKKRKKVLQERKKQKQQEQLQKTESMKKKTDIPEIQTNGQEKFQQLNKDQMQEQIVQKNNEKDEEIEAPQILQMKKSRQLQEEEQQMNEQLGGITLEDDEETKKQNQGAFEQDDDVDDMKNQLEERMKKFKSLQDLEEKDYPGFFTVKSFIMMLDATLKKPFFIRKKEEKTEKQSQATWHNEKKGVMMIENYYRNDEEEVNQNNIMQEIDEEINYSDQQELEHEYMRQIQLRQNRQKQKITEKLNKNKKAMSFEIDYDYFFNYFWPTVRHRHFSARNITPHLVWTEIFSTIKGGASAHLYPGLNLSQSAYINESANVFLTKDEKLDIFETYCQYQRWKIRSGGYDIMDAVNYILNVIRFKGYEGPDIHYIMIDQVQDLPHAIIYLLSRTVKYGVFYSGDTAQTIAKGIGFRFCDLKNLFDSRQFDSSLTLSKPKVKQLTVNFRSHNNILQLANSIVSSIQILFPKTIDRLNKQVSNIKGPKPMILAESDQQLLFYVLCGDQSYKNNVSQTQNQQALKKPPLQFGCDQVIIVRDQQSKNRVPSMLQHALCLTIYEAKGLEFNDVILFNFFTESKCPEKWNLLKFLRVVLKEMDKDDYERSITKHQQENDKQKDMEQQDKQIDVDCIVEKDTENKKINIKKIVSDSKIYMKDINDYAELCSELKMLYTAITRPRKTLIIYDEDGTARRPLEKLWDKLQVVELVSKQILENTVTRSNRNTHKETEEIKIFRSIVNSTNNTEWKKQGLKMFGRGYFEQAMKCFQRSGDKQLLMKAEANMIADNASKKLIEIQSERSAIKNHLVQYQKMNESQISKIKKQLKKDQANSYTQFTKAGAIFEDLLLFKQAGQCYFSGKIFNKSFENFSKAFMHKQAAQSLEMLNKYRQAADYYLKDDHYLKAIECYDMLNQWQTILLVIQKYSHLMTEIQKQSLFKKYSALALQQLVYEIEFQNQIEGDEKKNHDGKNERIQIIRQEEDSEEQEDWDDDPQLAAEKAMRKRSGMFTQSDKSENFEGKRKFSQIDSQRNSAGRKISMTESEPMRKQSRNQEDKIILESVYENIQEKQTKNKPEQNITDKKLDESSFADLNDSQQQPSKQENIIEQSVYQEVSKKQQKVQQNKPKQNNDQKNDAQQQEDNSFAELISQQSSFADMNSMYSEEQNIKYPAQLQPDIQSIKSMADPEDSWIRSALSEIQARTNTEYSIIDQQQNYNPNIRIIKTKGNIFVQDEIMRKIVNIVGIVNSSVSEFFKQFKGYQSLITISDEKSNEDIIDNRPEISEFEDIDPKFINIILDTLESFKLHKLCLFVCNRYHMPHKAGRYLVSMALKYSTNATVNNTLNPSLISPSIHRKSELQKGILASIALHAIFENVSADFLKVKVSQKDEIQEQSKNSLGTNFIEGLLLQGIYKKAVFMVNPEQSLKLLYNYFDFPIYQEVFKQKIYKKQFDSFLPQSPKTAFQDQYTVMKLQSMLYDFNCLNKVDFISQRFYREFNITDIKLRFKPNTVPEYIPYIKALFSQDRQEIKNCIRTNIPNAYQKLKSGSDYEIYDIVGFLLGLISKYDLQSILYELDHNNFLQVYRCLKYIRHTLYNPTLTKVSFIILESIFSFYSCRIIKPCKSLKFIYDNYSLLKRTSIFCNFFVEEIKKKEECAFFFEQDYNMVIVRTIKLLQVIRRKYDLTYSNLLKNRAQYLQYNTHQIQNQSPFTYEGFLHIQTEQYMKILLREEEKLITLKKSKKSKQKEVKRNVKKKVKPNFSFKAQGRPQLAIDLNSDSQVDSQDENQQQKIVHTNIKFIFADLHPKLHYFHDTVFSLFDDKSHGIKNCISGRLLYCAGLNDSYKQYVNHMGGYNLYDAIQFKKFNRLDMYADNILSVVSDLAFSEKPIIIGQILTLLLIQYKLSLSKNKQCKIDITRDFLKFLPNLKLIQTIANPNNFDAPSTTLPEILQNNSHTCVFSFQYLYCSQLKTGELSELICEFLDILRIDQSYKNFSLQNLIIMYFLNAPVSDKQIMETLRLTINSLADQWSNLIFEDFKSTSSMCKDIEQFTKRRQKIINAGDGQFIKKYVALHQVRVQDASNMDKSIDDSERDYQIKEKILDARKKAAVKIAIWWKTMKKKQKPADQQEIVAQNKLIKSTYNIKYLPYDDRFLIRSAKIRNVLFSFYLSKIVTSSLDFHFILMTLNKIQELREKYLKAYSHALTEMEEIETDYEIEISNIEEKIDVWRKDAKWLKDRNLDLKRKKVFEVKWMTKNNIHNKIIKKRAGLKKQKNLQKKKELIKRR